MVRENVLAYIVKIDKWNVCLTLLKVDKKRRNYNPRKRLLRGVPWDYRFLNFKNITRDILSRKSLVKYLSSIYIPALPSWSPAFSYWFLTFPPWFSAFPPWFLAFPRWFPAFPRWFPMFPPWFPAFPPWFPSFPTWFPHSHRDSLHSHHSPHSVPWFPIPAFTDSLFLLVTNENNSLDVASKSYTRKLRYTLSSLVCFACGAIVIKPTKTILVLALLKLNPFTWTFKFYRD